MGDGGVAAVAGFRASLAYPLRSSVPEDNLTAPPPSRGELPIQAPGEVESGMLVAGQAGRSPPRREGQPQLRELHHVYPGTPLAGAWVEEGLGLETTSLLGRHNIQKKLFIV